MNADIRPSHASTGRFPKRRDMPRHFSETGKAGQSDGINEDRLPQHKAILRIMKRTFGA